MFWNQLFAKNKKKSSSTNESINAGNLKVVVLSDRGNIRVNNEDMGLFFRIADESIGSEKGSLLIVADGMGGHQAGEVASKLATEMVTQEYFKNSNHSSVEKNLSKAFVAANKKIFDLASSQKKYFGMGTTCTALIILEEDIYYAHVGDSRAYIWKNNSIKRITEDHTYVQELIRQGEISISEASTHPKRNILTNAMGTKPDVRVDSNRHNDLFELSDRLLLCSDGLYEYIQDEELAQILSLGSIQEAATTMVQEAKKRGGHDNITVLIAERIKNEDETSLKETRDFIIPQTQEHILP